MKFREKPASFGRDLSTISLYHPWLLLGPGHQPHAEWLTSIPRLHFQYDSVLNNINTVGQKVTRVPDAEGKKRKQTLFR